MEIEIKHNGIEISDIINNHLIHTLYIFYSKTEAIRLFKQQIKQLKSTKIKSNKKDCYNWHINWDLK